MKKTFLYVMVIGLLGAVFLIPQLRNKIQEQFFPVATIQNAVSVQDTDYDIILKGINVPDANLKDFKGKVVFLNFWGTWCPPCRQEWPTIQKLYDAKKNKMDFVLITMHDKEDAVKQYLAENNFNVPVYVAESPISQNLLPKAFPTTYIIDQKGQILKKEDTAEDWNAKEIHQFLDIILK